MFGDAVAYDTESSDTDVRHGQILEFGAVELDPASLEERGRVRIDVRLLPYVVPAPDALRVCGFAPQEIADPSRTPEPEAARQIASILKPGPGGAKLVVTFNGLKFDDELLRSTFWRNLLDPFVASGARIRRLDMLPLCQFAGYAVPDAIRRGRTPDGEPSWKLERLAEANGIPIKRAHRAEDDASATGGLMRLVRSGAPHAFSFAVACADGRRMEDMLDPVQANVLYQFSHYGEPKITPIVSLHRERGQALCAALDEECSPFLDGDAADVAARLFKPDGCGRVVRIKHTPLVFTANEAAALGLDVSAHDKHLAAAERLACQAATETAAEASRLSRDGYSDATTPEARIYSGFPSYADKAKMEAFHGSAPGPDRIRAAASIGDLRIREFAARLLTTFDGAGKEDFVAALGDKDGPALHALAAAADARPFAGAGSPWMTVEAARTQLRDGEEGLAGWLTERWRQPPAERPDADRRGQFSFGF